jgi:hypothetical protein
MDRFNGTSTGNHRFSHKKIGGVPINLPVIKHGLTIHQGGPLPMPPSRPLGQSLQPCATNGNTALRESSMDIPWKKHGKNSRKKKQNDIFLELVGYGWVNDTP